MKLSERAMLVNLHISTWTARKMDRKATKAVADMFNVRKPTDVLEEFRDRSIAADKLRGSTRKVGSYHKQLVFSATLERLIQHVTAVRTEHYRRTLPWLDNGARIVTVDGYMGYIEYMRTANATYEDLLSQFLAEYAAERVRAQEVLGDLWRAQDYPANVRDRFGFEVSFSPIPEGASDFRVKLPDSEIAALISAAQDRATAAMGNAMRDAWQRVHERVSRVAERLSDEEATFRDSLIDNVRDLAELLPTLNVAQDPALDEMADTLRAKLGRHTPDALRDNQKTRREAANSARSILAALDARLGISR